MPDKKPVPFLDLRAQQARIATDLRRRLDTVLEHCQFVLGPEVRELEAALAEFCGAKHCVSVSSGTDALQIALMAERIGPGDAVFLPAFTYTATAEVPVTAGGDARVCGRGPRHIPDRPGSLDQPDTADRSCGKVKSPSNHWR